MNIIYKTTVLYVTYEGLRYENIGSFHTLITTNSTAASRGKFYPINNTGTETCFSNTVNEMKIKVSLV